MFFNKYEMDRRSKMPPFSYDQIPNRSADVYAYKVLEIM